MHPDDFALYSKLRPALRLASLLLLGAPWGIASDPPPAAAPPTPGFPAAIARLPEPGRNTLQVLTPTLLELSLIEGILPGHKPAMAWDWADAAGRLQIPDPTQFRVAVGNHPISVRAVGYRRRVLYAPRERRDLRVGTFVTLQLAEALPEGSRVELTRRPTAGAPSAPPDLTWLATMDPMRLNPALHVNQTGYHPQWIKHATVGHYLGTLGELAVTERTFALVDAWSGEVKFRGALRLRPDVGFGGGPPYQAVLEADFSVFRAPGEYRIQVSGMGVSLPFRIDEGVAASWARAYALGLYHQRCGTSNGPPFSRFVHPPCHVAPAYIPDQQFSNTARLLAQSAMESPNAAQTAPPLRRFEDSLYPFVRHGRVDVSGGHHDAGDYSKYVINSAGLLHTLVFAADALPGVGALDNLGLPESQDGRSDVLQEAAWEADFIARMQDEDGGFYFLVYPRERRYEDNVKPDQGDEQVVWPKTTSATAACVAALAQTSSSPLFRHQFPAQAERYLKQARRGWAFLERAIQAHGRAGAYQKITHYGDQFQHEDELTWAACELFLATGEERFHKELETTLHPDDARTRRWGWQRLCEGYGRAIRSYAFGARTGRVPSRQLDLDLLMRCERELVAGADDIRQWAERSAYGTSFPTETKRFRGGGWYFSSDMAFDLAVACALGGAGITEATRPYLETMLSNFDYELGANPVNQSFVTGLGWNRPRSVVAQFALNDFRRLPPSGLPIGNIQTGPMWLDHYGKELGALSYPSDGAPQAPYPLYDRWSDSFNVQTEFVVLNQGRALAAAAYLMAQTSCATQQWRSAAGTIALQDHAGRGPSSVTDAALQASGVEMKDAQVLWEGDRLDCTFTRAVLECPSSALRPGWIEAEAVFPDGRRVVGAWNSPGSGLHPAGKR